MEFWINGFVIKEVMREDLMLGFISIIENPKYVLNVNLQFSIFNVQCGMREWV
jgi:hypothetical protein